MHTRAHGDKPWIAEMCAPPLPTVASQYIYTVLVVPCLSILGMRVVFPLRRYGYVLGAAKANVWHNPADYFHWMYPGYFTSGAPKLHVYACTHLPVAYVLGYLMPSKWAYKDIACAAQSRRGYCTMACSGR